MRNEWEQISRAERMEKGKWVGKQSRQNTKINSSALLLDVKKNNRGKAPVVGNVKI